MSKNKQKPTTKVTKPDENSSQSSAIAKLKPVSRGGWIVLLFSGLLLLAIGTYATVRIIDDNRQDNIKQEAEDPRFPKQEVILEQLKFETLNDRVNKLQLSKQYTEAKKLIKFQDYYDNNKQAQLLYASLCLNQGNKKEATETLTQAEDKFGESSTLAASIADSAAAAGEKDMAIKYYNKAIDLTDKDESNPVRGADTTLYKEKLKKLEEN